MALPLSGYSPAFGAAGAAGGIGLLGGLGRLLEPLDYARQALWNIPGKLAEGDVGAALPGILGLGTGIGLAATGLGIPAALLGGSLAGGISQGIGRQVNEDRFEAPKPSALTEALGIDPESGAGQLTSFGLGMAGDPLSWTGGGLGELLGSKYGRYAARAGRFKGPGYEGMESLRSPIPPRQPGDEAILALRQKAMLEGPHAAAVAGELNPAYRATAHGAEGIFYSDPTGAVPGGTMVRGGPHTRDLTRETLNMNQDLPGFTDVLHSYSGERPLPRVESEMMVQPVRSKGIGEYRIEHLPKVETGPSSGIPKTAEGQEFTKTLGDLRPGMKAAAFERDLLPNDVSVGNMARTPEGKFLFSDAGSLLSNSPLDYPPNMPNVPGDPVTNVLLKMLGSKYAVRKQIEQGLARGTAGQGLSAAELLESLARNPLPVGSARLGPGGIQDLLRDVMAAGPVGPRGTFSTITPPGVISVPRNPFSTITPPPL